MTGQAFINNKDLDTWGALLAKGAYEALLKPAPLKELPTNTSRLQHGTRPIATADTIRWASRTINISLWIIGSSQSDYLTKYKNLITEITSGIFTLKVPALGTIYNLLYSDCSSFGDYGLTKGKITLKLTEPNPDERTNI